jgi:hypothetical protein
MVVVCFDEAAAQGFGEHCRDSSANLQEKKRERDSAHKNCHCLMAAEHPNESCRFVLSLSNLDRILEA